MDKFDVNYFNGSGDIGYSNYSNQHGYLKEELNIILSYFSTNIGKILDVGCAYGYLTEMLYDKGMDVWGTDISSYAISQSNIPKRMLTGDIRNLPYKDKTFDLVICIYTLECLKTPQQIYTVLQELKRVGKNYYIVCALGNPFPYINLEQETFKRYINMIFYNKDIVFQKGYAFKNPIRCIMR